MTKYRINPVVELVFDSKAKAEEVADLLVKHNILFDLVPVTLTMNPFNEDEGILFEDSSNLEKFDDYKKRKKL